MKLSMRFLKFWAVVVTIGAQRQLATAEAISASRFSLQNFEMSSLPLVDFGDGDIRTYPTTSRDVIVSLDPTDAANGSQSLRYTLQSGTAYPEWDPYNY